MVSIVALNLANLLHTGCVQQSALRLSGNGDAQHFFMNVRTDLWWTSRGRVCVCVSATQPVLAVLMGCFGQQEREERGGLSNQMAGFTDEWEGLIQWTNSTYLLRHQGHFPKVSSIGSNIARSPDSGLLLRYGSPLWYWFPLSKYLTSLNLCFFSQKMEKLISSKLEN